jgi:YgiT-type zinc finger domain-containing protein
MGCVVVGEWATGLEESAPFGFQGETEMKCILCGGETHDGEVVVTLNRGETVAIIKGVPAQVCENCGEYFLSKEANAVVPGRADEAVAKGAEVEILRFAA